MRLVETESASESAENMDAGGLVETTISVSGELSATREAAVGVEVELTLQMLTLGLKDSK